MLMMTAYILALNLCRVEFGILLVFVDFFGVANSLIIVEVVGVLGGGGGRGRRM